MVSKGLWTKNLQCPCGDWKCFIHDDGEAESIKNDPQPTEQQQIFTPYVGMVFKSDADALDFYGTFARKNGFSVRKERSRLSSQLGIYKRDLVCYRAGFAPVRKKQLSGENQRDRKSIRCGCDARMYLSKEIVDGGASLWCVVQFSNVHNHELLEDDQLRLLPAYRKINEADQERILLLSRAGFPINRIVKVFELEKGIGGAALSFLERDVRNFIQNRRRKLVGVQEEGDLEYDLVELLEACRGSKEADQFFTYDASIDENGRVENVAWCFGDSIRSYDTFGDAVYLESSYRSTAYAMFFVAFLGIDNHGELLCLGCCLLQDESTSSFSWALKVFLRFMKGRSPQTIVTDADHRIREAVKKELPNTKHVIPLHRILGRIPGWFSVPLGSRFPEFRYEFEEVLCSLECSDEFEFQWNQMSSHFRLNADRHISLLFTLRSFWALPYTRGCFTARINSASYSKSVDTFMNRLLNSPPHLLGIFQQVRGVLSKLRRPPCQYMLRMKTCLPMEEHACGILTPYAFADLQQEMAMAMQYAASEMADGSYLVRHRNKLDGEQRLVVRMPEGEQIHCSCQGFETTGIVCRHAVRILLSKNYFQIPSRYLPNRWRRERIPIPKDEWLQEFESQIGALFSEAALSKERSDFVRKELTSEMNRLITQVRAMPAANAAEHDD